VGPRPEVDGLVVAAEKMGRVSDPLQIFRFECRRQVRFG
jgi:hypothetical protein